MIDKTKSIDITGLRLINWYNFVDTTIDIKKSALITGHNGSGKSVILDAMQTVLRCDGTKFNFASKVKDERTLLGYVRCAVKSGDSFKYIRSEGAVISYVAIQFHSFARNSDFVLGGRFTSADINANIRKEWFVVDGVFDDINFIEDKKPVEKKKFTNKGKIIPLITNKGEALRAFNVKMGVGFKLGTLESSSNNAENVSELAPLIRKTLAFNCDEGMHHFIRNFLLPSDNVNIENLFKSLEAYKGMRDLADQKEKDLEKLKEIKGKAEEVFSYKDKILKHEILSVLTSIKKIEDNLIVSEERKKTLETAHEANTNKKKKLFEQIKTTNNEYYELVAAINNSDFTRYLESLSNSISTLTLEVETERNNCELLDQCIVNIINTANVAGIDISDLEIDTLKDLLSESKDRLTIVLSLKDRLYEKSNSILSSIGLRNKDLAVLTEKNKEIEYAINNLRRNKPVYDNRQTDILIEEINKEFEKRGIKDSAKIFAEIIEVTDDDWRNAIEGYLGPKRFNIIVQAKNYDIAAEVYCRIKNKVQSVGLVNAQKIEDIEIKRSSLAEMIDTDNDTARNYVNYLLGNVICCDDESDLKNHHIAITKDCMLYQSHVLRRIPDSLYKTPYIGKQAIEMQLQVKENEYAENKSEIQKLESELSAMKLTLAAINKCDFSEMTNVIDSYSNFYEKKSYLNEKIEEKSRAKKDVNFIENEKRKEILLEKLSFLDVEHEDCTKALGSQETDIKNLNKDIALYSENINELEDSLKTLSDGHSAILDEARASLNKKLEKWSVDDIISNNKRNLDDTKKQKDETVFSLRCAQREYDDGSLGEGIECISDYLAEFNKVKNYIENLHANALYESQKALEKSIREDFLAQIKEKIELANRIFKDLNETLGDITYNDQSYKFTIGKNSALARFYNMIMNSPCGNEFTFDSLLFEQDYKEEFEELLNFLSNDNTSTNKSFIDYADYRSYLEFDIQVTNADGSEYSLSKSKRTDSGGEFDTPLYVALASSFIRLYKEENTVRFLLLDEAFGKMDDIRIKGVLDFLEKCGFQLFIVCPTEASRVETIGKYVNTYISVFKKTNGVPCVDVSYYDVENLLNGAV